MPWRALISADRCRPPPPRAPPPPRPLPPFLPPPFPPRPPPLPAPLLPPSGSSGGVRLIPVFTCTRMNQNRINWSVKINSIQAKRANKTRLKILDLFLQLYLSLTCAHHNIWCVRGCLWAIRQLQAIKLQDYPIAKWYKHIMVTLKRTQWLLQHARCLVLCWFVAGADIVLRQQIKLHDKNIPTIIILTTEGLVHYFSHLTLDYPVMTSLFDLVDTLPYRSS